MPIRRILVSSLLFFYFATNAQINAVYHTADLLERIASKDTIYVVNFWALWCKPCIEELPALDSLNSATKDQTVKVLLVNIDFLSNKKKVNSFLSKKRIGAECVLLDEINGNDFIDKISKQWSGAIPATLFKKGDETILLEKKTRLSELQKNLKLIEAK